MRDRHTDTEEPMASGTRRTLAQILGAMSVASCSALTLAPIATNQAKWEIALSGLILSALLALSAVVIQRR